MQQNLLHLLSHLLLLISKLKMILKTDLIELFLRIGRRAPLAVLTLISGLSSVSLAITLLGTGLINIKKNSFEN